MKKLLLATILMGFSSLFAKESIFSDFKLYPRFSFKTYPNIFIKRTIKNYQYSKIKLSSKKSLYKRIDFSQQYAKGIYTIKNRRIIKVPLPVGFKQYGLASYYHSKFAGLKTSNGERLNLNALTAAHRTLPFNTLVKVTNLKNGRSVIVRINDRGPFVRGRIIDLSQKAAKKLGIYHKGVAKIKLEVIG